MIHSGNQRLITALREARQRPTVGIFTHVKSGIDQRNNILHELFIRRLRIKWIEGFAPLLRREVFRYRFRDIGFGIRDHHQHRLNLALRQQVIHDLRDPPLIDGRQAAVAKAMIEIEHRQRIAGSAIARRRPDIETTFGVQSLRVIGEGAQIAMRNLPIVKNTARHQNQTGVHLALRLLIAAAGIYRAEAIHIEIVFIEIGLHRLAFPCPDSVRCFGHVVRDKGVRRGASHYRDPPGIRGKQAVGDTLIRVNLGDKVAHRQAWVRHRG